MKRPAVFVIDMLNYGFGHAELDRIRAEICSSINQLTNFARSQGFPAIWIRQQFEPDLSDAFLDMKRENIRMFIKDTSGARILDKLVRDDSDIEIVRSDTACFTELSLNRCLKSWTLVR